MLERDPAVPLRSGDFASPPTGFPSVTKTDPTFPIVHCSGFAPETPVSRAIAHNRSGSRHPARSAARLPTPAALVDDLCVFDPYAMLTVRADRGERVAIAVALVVLDRGDPAQDGFEAVALANPCP